MKADDLRSLERTERMTVRWMCGVSLKDRKRSEDLCNLLSINCVADVVRRGRLRWFGHLERKSVDDWVSACRGLVVEGTRGRGRSRKTWEPVAYLGFRKGGAKFSLATSAHTKGGPTKFSNFFSM